MWWSRAANKWMDLNRWDAAAIRVKEEHFAGFKVFLGVDYVDESRTPRFAETLDPVNLDVREFSTIPDVTGDHGLTFGIGPGTRIHWTGPLRSSGNASSTNHSWTVRETATSGTALSTYAARRAIYWSRSHTKQLP